MNYDRDSDDELVNSVTLGSIFTALEVGITVPAGSTVFAMFGGKLFQRWKDSSDVEENYIRCDLPINNVIHIFLSITAKEMCLVRRDLDMHRASIVLEEK